MTEIIICGSQNNIFDCLMYITVILGIFSAKKNVVFFLQVQFQIYQKPRKTTATKRTAVRESSVSQHDEATLKALLHHGTIVPRGLRGVLNSKMFILCFFLGGFSDSWFSCCSPVGHRPGCLIKDSPENPPTSQHYVTKKFNGGPCMRPHYTDRPP